MKKSFVLLLAPVLLWGCEKAMLNEGGGINKPEETPAIDDTPYPIVIMQQAMAEVTGTETTRSETPEIEPTHRYIEFTPATFEEYYRLLGSEEIECSPLSGFEQIEIPEENNYISYTREEMVGPEKLYAMVESHVTLPDGIAYKVLEELYSPFAAGTDPGLAGQVAARARALAGIAAGSPGTPIDHIFIPRGTIKMEDRTHLIPLANVTIRITEMVPVYLVGQGITVYFPRTETVKTDANGYYSFSKTYSSSRIQDISILWEMGSITITDAAGNVGVTSGRCNYLTGEWNATIDKEEDAMAFYFASIFRAVNVATTGGTDVLDFLGHYVQLQAQTTEPNPLLGVGRYIGEYPFAKIYCGGDSNSYEIMERCWYDLGRICFYAHNHLYFAHTTYETVLLSWGAFTNYYFRTKEGNRIGRNLHDTMIYHGEVVQVPDNTNMQNWRCSTYSNYIYNTKIPLFIDLYDDFNQYEYRTEMYYDDKQYPNDNISLPFEVIYKIVLNSGQVRAVKDNVIKEVAGYKYGCTSIDIEHFFNEWTYGKYVNDEKGSIIY